MEHYYLTQSTRIEDILYLIENGLINIAVCDERVVASSFVKDKDYLNILKNENIYLVNKFLGIEIGDKNDDVFININKKGEGLDCRELKKKNIFILILHLGILDKLEKNKNSLNEIIDELYKCVPHIFITSGRGEEISNVLNNEKVKFINYSIVAKFLVNKNPSKLFLIRQLMIGGIDESICDINKK